MTISAVSKVDDIERRSEAEDRFVSLRLEEAALGVGTVDHFLVHLGDLIGDLVSGGTDQPLADRLWPTPAADGRLALLADSLQFDEIDIALFVCAVAPALDARFGALYSTLDTRYHRGLVSIDLALRLAGGSLLSMRDRERFGPGGSLVRAGFLEVLESAMPLPDRTLSVPERVVTVVFSAPGERPVWSLDPNLEALLIATADIECDETRQVMRSLTAGLPRVWVRDRTGGGASISASALARLGVMSLVLDLDRLPSGHGLAEVAESAAREACLWNGSLVLTGVDLKRDHAALRSLTRCPRPIVFVSRGAWDPAVSSMAPVLVEAPRLVSADRIAIWRESLEGIDLGADELNLAESIEELAELRLSPEQIVNLADHAVSMAIAGDQQVTVAMLRSAAFTRSTAKLDSLTLRVSPIATFADIVLPDDVLADLLQLPDRYRCRDLVRDAWGMDRTGGRGRGITCLFAGPSGTGKTLAAEVVANSLGVELFIINLSQVVDKYVGETEKTLERIFSEAENLNAVLLFDEADALFGKRSEVKGAHDRYANVEVAYLLQRLERFEGVAVLTTNLKGNIDEAFMRRLDLVCAFPEPSPPERLQIWNRQLPKTVPREPDVDLDILASSLPIAGGTIRNIALSAAYAAAIGGGKVSMAHLVSAAEREYRKLGRLFNVAELKQWMTST